MSGTALKDGTPRHARRGFPRGVSLLEVLIAMAVLGLAAAGAIVGMLAASRDVRDGQLLQAQRMLLEAHTQRLWLAAKAPLLAKAVTRPSTFPPDLAPGTAPWGPDTSAVVAGDPGSGAYFKMLPSGQVESLTTVAANTPCNSPTLEKGTYCRELLVTLGLPKDVPAGAAALLPPGAQPVTVWARVVRVGDDATRAVVHSEVFVQ